MTVMDLSLGGLDMAMSILLAVIVVLIVFGVVTTFIRTRSWVPAVGALLVGVVVLWMANSIPALTELFDNTVTEAGRRGAVSDEDMGRVETSDLDGSESSGGSEGSEEGSEASETGDAAQGEGGGG